MQNETTPKVELTFDSFGDFVADSATWLSKSLAFIATEEMLPIGSPVEIDVTCDEGQSLVRGLGRVSWVRKQQMRADQPAGLGIGFVSLEAASEALIDALDRYRTTTGLDALASGGDELSIDAVLDEVVPEDAATEDSAPEDPAPEDPAPEDPAPEDSVTEDRAPEHAMLDEIVLDGVDAERPAADIHAADAAQDDAGIDDAPSVEDKPALAIDGNALAAVTGLAIGGSRHDDPGADASAEDQPAEEIETELRSTDDVPVDETTADETTADDMPVTDTVADSMTVPSNADIAALGTMPIAASGKLGEISFSDVEAAVSREIDAVVLHEKIRQERAAREEAAEIEDAPIEEAEVEAEAEDIEAVAIEEGTTEEVEAASEDFEDIDDDAFLAPLDLALAEVKPEAEPTVDERTSLPIETEDVDTAAIPIEAAEDIDTAAIPIEAAEDIDTAAIPIEAAEDIDTAAILVEPEEAETAQVELASDELEFEHVADETDEADTQVVTEPDIESDPEIEARTEIEEPREAETEMETVAAEDEATDSDVESQDAGAEVTESQDAESQDSASDATETGAARAPGPNPNDPWDLDVSSFLDDALREQASAERASSGPFPKPVRQTPAAAAETPPPADGDSMADTAPIRTREPEDDDTLDFGVPRSAIAASINEDASVDDTPIHPSVATRVPESQHPEARVDGDADDETLDGIAARTRDVTTPGPKIADMDAEPDFDTMAARLEVPKINEPPTPLVTVPIETIPELPAVTEAPKASPSSIDLRASVAAVAAAQSPAAAESEESTPASGYYARAGRKRGRLLPMLAAVLALAALGAGLYFSGMLDGPLAQWRGDAPDATSTVAAAPPVSTTPTPTPAPAPSDDDSADSASASPGDADTASDDTDVRVADGTDVRVADGTDPETPDAIASSDTATKDDDATADPQPAIADTSTAGAAPQESESALHDARSAPQDADTAAAGLESTLEAWAAAWSLQDPDAYLDIYDAAFETPDGVARDAWNETRRQRLRAPSSIRVSVSDFEVESWDGDRAQVRVYQSYRTESRNLGTWKRFDMVWRDGQWRILREAVVR